MNPPKRPGGQQWRPDLVTSVSISGRHRSMIDSWQFAMELTAERGKKPPSVKDAAEHLLELGWAMAHLPPGRRTSVLMEIMDLMEAKDGSEML